MHYTLDSVKDIQMCHPTTFGANYLVQHLSTEPFWTVSDDNKRPVDAKQLLETGVVENASLDGESPLVPLTALDADSRLMAVNRAYRLHAKDNRVIAIDVEPEAPQSMKEMVLNFPAHYTELSRNGGVHLFIKVPDDLVTDDNRYMFDELSVFKEPIPKGENRPAHFEVMFNDHYITFTKRMLTDKPCVDYNKNPAAKGQLERFLTTLFKMDKQRRIDREIAKQYKVELFDKSITPEKQDLIEQFLELQALDDAKQKAGEKQPADYGNDMSRYESAVSASLAGSAIRIHNMAKRTISFADMADALKDTDLIYAVYLMIKDILPYRDKHEEFRDDLPWLMYVAKGAYEYTKAQDAQRKKK